MNIALYFYQISGAGGAERMICRLANAFGKQGHNVCIISLDRPGAVSYYPLDHDVTWVRIGRAPGLKDKLRRTCDLRRALIDRRIDVLAGFVMSGDKTVYAAAKLASVRLIAAERNAPAMYHLRYGWLTRWTTFALLHLVDRIVVQFPDYIVNYPKTLRARISAIGNPVDPAVGQARPDHADAKGRFTLLAVGRLDPVQKRMMTLVDAFAKVASKHPAWDLRIVGNGPERSDLLSRIDALGLGARCTIETDRPDIFALYTEAQLFVMPSLWEGFPNALAEALAHGLPAVGFDGAPGVRNLIDESGGGWLAQGCDDAETLAHSLDEAMSDHAQRALRGDRAKTAMQAYAPQKQVSAWLALLENAMAGHS